MTRRHVVTPMHATSRPPGDLASAKDRALRLADEFLGQSAQWGAAFDPWAAGLRLTPADRRAVRVAVIVKRNFSSNAR
jgi:hypothetical protein